MGFLEQGFSCLEKGDWDGAGQCFRQVLSAEPSNSQAHMGVLLWDLRARNVDELGERPFRFDNRMSYHEALPYLNPEQKASLMECIDRINARNEQIRLKVAYEMGCRRMETAGNTAAFLEAAQLFAKIAHYRNAADLEAECRRLAEAARKDAMVAEAVFWMQKDLPDDYGRALNLLYRVPGWKDADRLTRYCEARLQQFRDIEERERKWKERVLAAVRKTLRFALPGVAAALVVVFLIVWHIHPAIRYKRALSWIEAGNVIRAYETLVELQGYADSEAVAEEIRFSYNRDMLKQVEPGDYVNFGAYTQTSDGSGLVSQIDWLVLARQDDRVLVLSRMALDSRVFHPEVADITWADSQVRSWLNGEFYSTAFSAQEQEHIALTELDGATQDRIFLLSVEEVEAYLPAKSDRWCDPTLYAAANGVWMQPNTNRCWWWLRTPGDRIGHMVYVGSEGTLQYRGDVRRSAIALRPAMWLRETP